MSLPLAFLPFPLAPSFCWEFLKQASQLPGLFLALSIMLLFNLSLQLFHQLHFSYSMLPTGLPSCFFLFLIVFYHFEYIYYWIASCFSFHKGGGTNPLSSLLFSVFLSPKHSTAGRVYQGQLGGEPSALSLACTLGPSPPPLSPPVLPLTPTPSGDPAISREQQGLRLCC